MAVERLHVVAVDWRDQQAGTTRKADRYIIEVGTRTAGIVVRDRTGYRFFAAEPKFFALEGQVFRRPRDAERAAMCCAGKQPLQAA